MFFSFETGDYVLHPKYGVGCFVGIEYIELNGIGYDFVKLEYVASSYVFIPTFNTGILKFHSSKDSNTVIETMGKSSVLRKQNKVREDLAKIAHELAQLAARRQLADVQSFHVPGDYSEFEKECGFELTTAQEKSVKEVLADLAKTKPMDRLICGDVGFGKTEVAIRAMFTVVRGGARVIFIVPTTILAQQHYDLFCDRFSASGIRCGISSRLHGTSSRDVDILVTTANNRNIAELSGTGLIVLDEEHRFGAKFKEEIRGTMHCMQLSASPIPRTLNMALSGLKDISILDTPPNFKKDIVMHISNENDLDLDSIIQKEIESNGRVFLVVPRISFIDEVAKKLNVYSDKYIIMHGQLKREGLQENLQFFKMGIKPIMIGTNIIESGINILEANLMIVFRAHLFGTAQLYQLRGRVGRASTVGVVYFVVPDVVSECAIARLELIKEHNYLGANFSLAQHDISLRGGGTMLGDKQWGKDYGFGLEAYYEMLTEAIQQETGVIQKQASFHVMFEGFSSAFIPPGFMPCEHSRICFYKKLSTVTCVSDLEQVSKELVHFAKNGKLPEELENFLELIKLKCLAVHPAIRKIIKKKNCFTLNFDLLNMELISKLADFSPLIQGNSVSVASSMIADVLNIVAS